MIICYLYCQYGGQKLVTNHWTRWSLIISSEINILWTYEENDCLFVLLLNTYSQVFSSFTILYYENEIILTREMVVLYLVHSVHSINGSCLPSTHCNRWKFSLHIICLVMGDIRTGWGWAIASQEEPRKSEISLYGHWVSSKPYWFMLTVSNFYCTTIT